MAVTFWIRISAIVRSKRKGKITIAK
jgi:hypothetical protein